MSKPRVDPTFGISSVDVLILTERHPACRWRESQPGSCKERENLAGDAKGKGTSGANREAESTDAPERSGLPRSSDEAAVMVVERKGEGHRGWVGSTGNGRNPTINGRQQPSCDGTSRISREAYVRICERLGVKFPGPTRQKHFDGRLVTSGLAPTPAYRCTAPTDAMCQEETWLEHRKPLPQYCATPRALAKLVSNSDGSPGQQERGAKRDQQKSRPIRFDPKAASRSFRFQRVIGSPERSRLPPRSRPRQIG